MPTIKKSSHKAYMPERVPFARRTHANHTFYTSAAWRQARAAFLKAHPLCQACREEGRFTLATVVDHIKPINEGGAPLDAAIFQALCAACHNRKSGSEAWKSDKDR